MRLDYGTQLSPTPIKLSIGTLKKPKLIEISELGFDQFNLFEVFAKMTPETFFSTIKGENGKKIWDSFSDKQKDSMTMYGLILEDESLQKTYVDLFNFFFIEPVVFKEGLFVLLDENVEINGDITPENVRGVIHEETFTQILELIQQICCIYEKEESTKDLKFKNNAARKIYEKIQKAQKEEKSKKKADINLLLPNIISAVSNFHQTINPINVWDMTTFQLMDSFNRLRMSAMYDIDSTRVSVWGDEKKTFDIALWYKNEYDKK